MKKHFSRASLLFFAFSLAAGHASAAMVVQPSKTTEASPKVVVSSVESLTFLNNLNKIRYAKMDKKEKVKDLTDLVARFEKQFPEKDLSATQRTIYAAILACLAKEKGSFDALSLAKRSRDLLLLVLSSKTPGVLDGYAYVTLAALYLNVPRWPIGFGNTEEAFVLIKKALAENPDSIDANFYLANYFIKIKKMDVARESLKKVLSTPVRADHRVGDLGRKEEAEELLLSITRR